MEKDIKNIIILKGNFVFTKTCDKFEIYEDSYIVVNNSYIVGIFKEIPKEYKYIKVKDYEGKLIIPGFVDFHLHAPQYTLRGIGYNKTLLEWLNNYTFQEEAKFEDKNYAEKVYKDLVEDLYNCGTTRSVIFGSIHTESTEILMKLLNEKGLVSFVGKVNMDRNSPKYLIEDTEESINETVRWVKEYKDKYENVKPIITPRFVPSCSSKLMKELGNIAKNNNVPVQSHLSENLNEINWLEIFIQNVKTIAQFMINMICLDKLIL